jgi:hypothetical protein
MVRLSWLFRRWRLSDTASADVGGEVGTESDRMRLVPSLMLMVLVALAATSAEELFAAEIEAPAAAP